MAHRVLRVAVAGSLGVGLLVAVAVHGPIALTATGTPEAAPVSPSGPLDGPPPATSPSGGSAGTDANDQGTGAGDQGTSGTDQGTSGTDQGSGTTPPPPAHRAGAPASPRVPNPDVLFSFERGAGRWAKLNDPDDGRVTGQRAFVTEGARGLRLVNRGDPDYFGTRFARPLDLRSASALKLDLRAGKHGTWARIELSTGSSQAWCHAPSWRWVGPGRTVTLSAPLRSLACESGKPDLRRTTAVHVGLGRGTFDLDNVRLQRPVTHDRGRSAPAPDPFPEAARAREPAGVVRIMPFGDSITGGEGCYRKLLWRALDQAGYRDLDFVGSLRRDDCPGDDSFDADTEGHSGYQATVIARKRLLPYWLAAGQPRIVLMHLGTNDIYRGKTTAQILAAFDTLLAQLRAANPRMTVLVAQIIPQARPGCARCTRDVVSLDNALVGWARARTTAASPVILVDQWTGFDARRDTRLVDGVPDGVHPNLETGIQKVAARWLGPLRAVLDGRVPPSSRMTIRVRS